MALAAAGASAIVVVGGGVAYAVSSSVVDTSGVIHGCVSNAGMNGAHVLLVHDTSRACPRGTAELDWNQVGPAGPSTAGQAGLDVIEVTGSTDTRGLVTAVCPADHPYLVGGGGSANGGLEASQPETINGGSSPNAWFVRDSNGTESAEADALCAK